MVKTELNQEQQKRAQTQQEVGFGSATEVKRSRKAAAESLEESLVLGLQLRSGL